MKPQGSVKLTSNTTPIDILHTYCKELPRGLVLPSVFSRRSSGYTKCRSTIR